MHSAGASSLNDTLLRVSRGGCILISSIIASVVLPGISIIDVMFCISRRLHGHGWQDSKHRLRVRFMSGHVALVGLIRGVPTCFEMRKRVARLITIWGSLDDDSGHVDHSQIITARYSNTGPVQERSIESLQTDHIHISEVVMLYWIDRGVLLCISKGKTYVQRFQSASYM